MLAAGPNIPAASETDRPDCVARAGQLPFDRGGVADRAPLRASPERASPDKKSRAADRAPVRGAHVAVRVRAGTAEVPSRTATRIAVPPLSSPSPTPWPAWYEVLFCARPFVRSSAAPAPPAGSRRATAIPAGARRFRGNAEPR